MNGLDIYIYNKQSASIKDQHEVNISESKWNFIFEFLLKNVDSVYFSGIKHRFIDDEFTKTVFYLCEEIFLGDEDPPKTLLFKIKESSFLYNRNLLVKMWNYYEFPALYFSYYDSNQDLLISMIENEDYPTQIVNSINGITLLYPPHGGSDFLWIESSSDMPDLHFLKN